MSDDKDTEKKSNQVGLTAERLRQVLAYDPATGMFSRIAKVNGRKIGDPVGSRTRYGYCSIVIDQRHYQAHRLAWLYMTGDWPKADVDHADRNRANNKWDNIRAATRTQNNGNRVVQSNNQCGFKGVYWESITSKWKAQIAIDGRNTNLGRFDTAEAAHAAYMTAAEKVFGEFARGG